MNQIAKRGKGLPRGACGASCFRVRQLALFLESIGRRDGAAEFAPRPRRRRRQGADGHPPGFSVRLFALYGLALAVALILAGATGARAQEMGSTHGPLALVTVAPVGGLPLYAAPTATGSGNCLSSGNACTLATACSFVKQIATFLSAAGPINLANGTHNALDANNADCSVLGNGGGSSSQLVSIVGNCLSPSSVTIAVPNNAAGFYVKDGGEAAIGGVTFTLGTNAIGIENSGQSSVVDYASAGCPVIWGASGSGSTHVTGASGSFTNLGGGGETFTANFNQHWNFGGDAQFSAGGATSIPSAVSWTNLLTASGSGYYLNFVNWSATGAGVAGSTGVRAQLTGPGYMVLAGATPCATVFPGNSGGNCSFSFGAQDNAGDGFTGTGIVVGNQAPTINNPIVGAQTYSSLPGSPTAGQISHIIDGNASHCADGACTTPGTAITGGGGLDLLMRWNGSAWVLLSAQSQVSLPGTGTVTEQKNTAGAGLTATGNCDNVNSNAGSPCNYALALTSPIMQASPTNPTGTTSTASPVMMGLGATCTITPAYSTRIHVDFSGSISNSSTGNGGTVQVRIGSGTAPVNGFSLSGNGAFALLNSTSSTASAFTPWATGGVITGLTPGTAYWIDLAVKVIGGGTEIITGLYCSAFEM